MVADGVVFAGGSATVALSMFAAAGAGIDTYRSFVFRGEGFEEGAAAIPALMFGLDDSGPDADRNFVFKDCM